MSTDCTFEPPSLPLYWPCLAKGDTPTESEGRILDDGYHWFTQFMQLGTYGLGYVYIAERDPISDICIIVVRDRLPTLTWACRALGPPNSPALS